MPISLRILRGPSLVDKERGMSEERESVVMNEESGMVIGEWVDD